jgi:Uma2 family endonuclease
MLKTAYRPLTVNDYQELPEGPPYYQLIEGEIAMSPAPNRPHQHILRNITFLLLKFVNEHRLGEVYFAPCDVYLTDINVFQPDLVFVSNARKSILSQRGIEGAPELVVEILSPKTARLDKGLKRDIYARTGVEELWIVDPEAKEIIVYHLTESAESPAGTYSGRQKFTSRVLSGLQIPAAKVFQS